MQNDDAGSAQPLYPRWASASAGCRAMPLDPRSGCWTLSARGPLQQMRVQKHHIDDAHGLAAACCRSRNSGPTRLRLPPCARPPPSRSAPPSSAPPPRARTACGEVADRRWLRPTAPSPAPRRHGLAGAHHRCCFSARPGMTTRRQVKDWVLGRSGAGHALLTGGALPDRGAALLERE